MKIHKDISIRELTTFKIGGKSKYLFIPDNIDDVKTALLFLKENKLDYYILGEGSNVLIGSKDYNGGVISTLNLNKIVLRDSFICAEAGVTNTNLSIFCCEKDIKGFEFLYYMPGTVGGSSVMNARAFGASMSDIIVEVKAFNKELEMKTFLANEIKYDYKQSIFQNNDYFVVEVIFKIEKGDSRLIKSKMESNKAKRLETKQYDFPSAGCIFKNNYDLGIPSGKLIDELGLKGDTIGDAQVFEQHGNFIINKGNATSSDVIQLIEKIKNKAKKEKKINLECEVKFHGNF
ncbi:MAG: UDP-N-acetylmuramate dehydrogenase [Spirochaetota bacterium]|nr:UDP-N-acetylmuramate dehydrogenase [Spirochaetota bacterium]